MKPFAIRKGDRYLTKSGSFKRDPISSYEKHIFEMRTFRTFAEADIFRKEDHHHLGDVEIVNLWEKQIPNPANLAEQIRDAIAETAEKEIFDKIKMKGENDE